MKKKRENESNKDKNKNKYIKWENKKEFNKIWRIEYKEWGRFYVKNKKFAEYKK